MFNRLCQVPEHRRCNNKSSVEGSRTPLSAFGGRIHSVDGVPRHKPGRIRTLSLDFGAQQSIGVAHSRKIPDHACDTAAPANAA